MNYVPGLEGVVVGETSISHVEGDIGRLSYRGRVIEDVVHMGYLEAVYLVLFGEIPGDSELQLFKEYFQLSSRGALCRASSPGQGRLDVNAGRRVGPDLCRIR